MKEKKRELVVVGENEANGILSPYVVPSLKLVLCQNTKACDLNITWPL